MATKPLGGRRKVPSGWRLVTLYEIKSEDLDACRAGPFGSSISRKYFVEAGVPVIRGNNLSTNLTKFVAEDFAFVSEQRARDKYKNCLVRPGDLVFTCWGTIGQVGRIPEDGPFDKYVISNKQLKLRTDPSMANSRFVYYYVASEAGVAYIKSRAIGAAVPGINLGIMKSIPIALPPMAQQESIVEVLSAYDDLIENNRRRIQLLEQAARLPYKEWFVHLRFPGHEHATITDGVPEGWGKKSLTDLADSVSYGLTASSTQEEIGPKFLRITDIVPAILNWDEVPFCEATDKEIERNRLEIGDVVVARTGATVGYAKLISHLRSKAVYASYLVRFRFCTPTNSLIAGIFMESDSYKEHVKNHAGGAAQPNANAKVLGSAILLIPPQVLQEQFRVSVTPVLNQRDALVRQNTRLAQARDFLLPRLMNGEVTI